MLRSACSPLGALIRIDHAGPAECRHRDAEAHREEDAPHDDEQGATFRFQLILEESVVLESGTHRQDVHEQRSGDGPTQNNISKHRTGSN